MYTCVYTYVHAYVQTCRYVYIYTYMYTYMYIFSPPYAACDAWVLTAGSYHRVYVQHTLVAMAEEELEFSQVGVQTKRLYMVSTFVIEWFVFFKSHINAMCKPRLCHRVHCPVDPGLAYSSDRVESRVRNVTFKILYVILYQIRSDHIISYYTI